MSKDYQELYNVVSDIEAKAYNCGYNAGKGIAQTYEEGYKLGCKDAWKLAADIEFMTSCEVEDGFGIKGENVGFLCSLFTYEDALSRFRKWKEATSWEDVPADDMSLEQARQAVKDLRKKLAESIENNDIYVLEVTLLSIEEAEKISKEIRKADYMWWLRSPGYCDTMVAIVNGDYVDHVGLCVSGEIGIRPVLKFNPKSLRLKNGISFFYRGYDWDMITDDTALCKSIVGKCAFNVDGNSNKYESSDIKKWLNDWWKECKG